MRHFLLFAGDNYYPEGGIYDLVDQQWGSDIELDSVLQKLREKGAEYDWWHICMIDTFGMRKIEEGHH